MSFFLSETVRLITWIKDDKSFDTGNVMLTRKGKG